MKDKSFEGKIALITGASRGIGEAVSLGLAAQGAHVVLIARKSDVLEVVDDKILAIGGQATLLPMDLLNLREVDKIGPTLVERFGKLDIVVGNAGMLGPLSPATHIRPKEWEQVMALNFFSQIRLIRSVEPLLAASNAGRIVFTTTHLAQDFPAYWGPYSTSKAALDGFIRTYSSENAQTSICVNGVAPGAVDTEMLATAFPGGTDFPTKKPEEVVPTYLELLSDNNIKNGEIVYL